MVWCWWWCYKNLRCVVGFAGAGAASKFSRSVFIDLFFLMSVCMLFGWSLLCCIVFMSFVVLVLCNKFFMLCSFVSKYIGYIRILRSKYCGYFVNLYVFFDCLWFSVFYLFVFLYILYVIMFCLLYFK